MAAALLAGLGLDRSEHDGGRPDSYVEPSLALPDRSVMDLVTILTACALGFQGRSCSFRSACSTIAVRRSAWAPRFAPGKGLG